MSSAPHDQNWETLRQDIFTGMREWRLQGCKQALSERVNLLWLCSDSVCENAVCSPSIGGSRESYPTCCPNRRLGHQHD